jgi:hypothetical protein
MVKDEEIREGREKEVIKQAKDPERMLAGISIAIGQTMGLGLRWLDSTHQVMKKRETA